MDENSIETIFNQLQLPKEIKKSYEKIGLTRLYDWQKECLLTSNVWNGDNLIYCAPTSGGKTLVAELVLFKTVISSRKKAIFILPYVSLVIEKEKHLKKIVAGYNRSRSYGQKISVKGFFGEYTGSRSYKENIIICTIEKANGIFNNLLLRGRGSQLGCVAFDEIHVLGHSFNGYILEILISKIRFYNTINKDSTPTQQIPNLNSINPNTNTTSTNKMIQTIALSATVGNVQELATWLNSRLYITTFRPVPLIERIKAGDVIINPQGDVLDSIKPMGPQGKSDPDHVGLLTGDAMRKGQQVLIFCPSKINCAQTCRFLTESGVFISHKTNDTSTTGLTVFDELIAYRLKICEDILTYNPRAEETLLAGVKAGVAYHHAGLTSGERSMIELAFRNGWISVLAATSTLAAGVNLPAGCVLIRSLNIGREFLSVTQYRQMCGRAGRAGGPNAVGESILLVKSSEKERAIHLVNQVLPDVKSQIHPHNDGGNALLKALLEVIALGLCSTLKGVVEYVRSTLLYNQAASNPSIALSNSSSHPSRSSRGLREDQLEVLDSAMRVVQFLVSSSMIDCDFKDLETIPCRTLHLQLTDANPYQQQFFGNSCCYGDIRVKITRFGRAIVRSGVGPDEAIVMYESLHRAQNGLILEAPLHLLFLITPLEHRLMPDFKKLLNMYEASQKSGQKVLARTFEAVGVDQALLGRWQVKPPSRAEIEMCSQAVKLYGIFKPSESDQNPQSTNTSIVFKPPTLNVRSGMSKENWKALVNCKRLWAALLLQAALMDGRPMGQLVKDFGASEGEVEGLKRGTKMMVSRVQKFSSQVGWTVMERLVEEFRPWLDAGVSPEVRALLKVPSMTRKIALVLVEKGVDSVEKFLELSPEAVAQFLHLSIGFQLQELEEIEVQLEEKETKAEQEIIDLSGDQEGTEDSQGSKTALEKSDKPVKTRDEELRFRLTCLAVSLQNAARSELQKHYDQLDTEASQYMEILTSKNPPEPSQPPPKPTIHPYTQPTKPLDKQLDPEESSTDSQSSSDSEVENTNMDVDSASGSEIGSEEVETVLDNEDIVLPPEEDPHDPLCEFTQAFESGRFSQVVKGEKVKNGGVEVEKMKNSRVLEISTEKEQIMSSKKVSNHFEQFSQTQFSEGFSGKPVSNNEISSMGLRSQKRSDDQSPAPKLAKLNPKNEKTFNDFNHSESCYEQSIDLTLTQNSVFSSVYMNTNIKMKGLNEGIQKAPYDKLPRLPSLEKNWTNKPIKGINQISFPKPSQNPVNNSNNTIPQEKENITMNNSSINNNYNNNNFEDKKKKSKFGESESRNSEIADDSQYFLSDEDLIGMMEELESSGVLVSNPDISQKPSTNNSSDQALENFNIQTFSYFPMENLSPNGTGLGSRTSSESFYLPQNVLNGPVELNIRRLPTIQETGEANSSNGGLQRVYDSFSVRGKSSNQREFERQLSKASTSTQMSQLSRTQYSSTGTSRSVSFSQHNYPALQEDKSFPSSLQHNYPAPQEESEPYPLSLQPSAASMNTVSPMSAAFGGMTDSDLQALMDNLEQSGTLPSTQLSYNEATSTQLSRVGETSGSEPMVVVLESENSRDSSASLTKAMDSISWKCISTNTGKFDNSDNNEEDKMNLVGEEISWEVEENEGALDFYRADSSFNGKVSFLVENKPEKDRVHSIQKTTSIDTKLISPMFRNFSPYATPFTASKINTPGNYLYFPLYDHIESSNSPVKKSPKKSSIDSPSKSKKQIQFAVDVVPSDFFEKPISERSIGSRGFLVRKVREESTCRQFLESLKSTKCVSFELVFRKLPISWLRLRPPRQLNPTEESKNTSPGEELSPSDKAFSPSPDIFTWSPFVSWSNSKTSSVTCSAYDQLLSTSLLPSKAPRGAQTFAPADHFLHRNANVTSARDMFRDPHVLVGIALNFGDEIGYYLPLPTPLPLIHVDDEKSIKSEEIEGNLDNLPENVREKICSYVGFEGLLSKCPLLTSYYSQNSPDNSLNNNNTESPVNNRNPLFFVSKKWCFSARKSLLMEWRKGGCLEWRVLGELMSNPSITKVGIDIKTKIGVLRERDILMEGPIEDPCLAAQLIQTMVSPEEEAEMAEEPWFLEADLRIPSVLTPEDSEIPEDMRDKREIGEKERDIEQGRKVACFRSVAAMRAMAILDKQMSSSCFSLGETQLSSSSSSSYLLNLYRNIEMPLIHTAADAEFCGIRIDPGFFTHLRKALKDRLDVVQQYCKTFCGSAFDVASLSDVADLKKKLAGNILKHISEIFMGKNNPIQQASIMRSLKFGSTQNGFTSQTQNGFSGQTQYETQNEDKAGYELFNKHAQSFSKLLVKEHPLMKVISEYRSHVLMLPLCSSLLGARYFDRVRAVYHTLGTDTGRVTLTNPPLQQIPHTCSYVPSSSRRSIHQEIMSCCNGDADDLYRVALYLLEINEQAATGLENSDSEKRDFSYKNSGEWVQVVSIPNRNRNKRDVFSNTSIGNAIDIDENGGKLVYGILVKVSDNVINDPDIVEPGDNNPFVEKWIQAGYKYTKDEKNSIRQVIIHFPTKDKIYKTNKITEELDQFSFPADKVYRLDDGVRGPDEEMSLLQSSFNPVWSLKRWETLCEHLKEVENTHKSDQNLLELPTSALIEAEQEEQLIPRTVINVRDGFSLGSSDNSQGFILLAADYCQVELRILAHFSKDPGLFAAFNSGIDVFRVMVARWKGRKIEEANKITTEERNQVKQICYALIYGAGPNLLAKQSNVSEEAAEVMMEDFLRQYKGIKRFIRRCKKQCRKKGFVETLLGRRRLLPDIRSFDMRIRGKAERQAVNTVCQGSAADLIKLAMINIHSQLAKFSRISQQQLQSDKPFLFRRPRKCPGGGLYRQLDDVRPVLQVHDELVFEVKKEYLPQVAEIVQHCMENAVILDGVPLQVKLSKGLAWGSLTEFNLKTEFPGLNTKDSEKSMGSMADLLGWYELKYSRGLENTGVPTPEVCENKVEIENKNEKESVFSSQRIVKNLFGKDEISQT